jgi:hypothetical protein
MSYSAGRAPTCPAFRATLLVPGYCARCGGAEFVHAHESWTCRPETCGGIHYDPCPVAIEKV